MTYDAVKPYRRCQPCDVHNEHERCTRRTTLGVQPGSHQDFCGCSCPQATVHREACLRADEDARQRERAKARRGKGSCPLHERCSGEHRS